MVCLASDTASTAIGADEALMFNSDSGITEPGDCCYCSYHQRPSTMYNNNVLNAHC
jgi:hypothetical protein